jgi:proteasome beta subunit
VVIDSGLPLAFTAEDNNSFIGFLSAYAADLLPWRRRLSQAPLPAGIPHGTTVLALVYADGVVMAGDRRATAGNLIAQNDLEKVHPGDAYSAVAFAGAVGIALELIRLFQVELEHYEKIEGASLSLEGKANRLSTMVKGNFELAQQGLAMVPLFAGYDLDSGKGRIFSVEITGGLREERGYYAVGSGSFFASGSMKKLFRPGSSEQEAVRVCVEALYDAADDDTATGGPDPTRQIYPILATVTAEGYRRYSGDEAGAVAQAVVEGRHANPGGPREI